MKKLLNILVFILLIVCVFDPADKIFSLKVPLFVISFILAILISVNQKKAIAVDSRLLNYFAIFSIILPLISFLIFLVFFRSSANFMGISAFKTYLFLSFILVLSMAEIDAADMLKAVLTILALAIIFLNIIVHSAANVESLNVIGKKYLIYSISYSANWLTKVPFYRIYFWTSPLLIFSVTDYVYKALKERTFKFYLLAIINVYGMYLSGSRGNQIISVFSILTIIYLYLYFSNKSTKYFLLGLTIIAIPLVFYFILPYLSVLFSANEVSNATKLSYVKDYAALFRSDVKIALFGQGIGTDFYVTTLKQRMFFTELTYFELFRKFGLIMGSVYIILLLYPVFIFLSVKNKSEYAWLITAYAFYLLMSFFNPFFFSSSGIIILSVVLTTLISVEKEHSVYLNRLKII